MKRNTLTVVTLLIVLFATSSTHAQLGIYGEYNATHIPATSFTGTTAGWYQGFTGGAYYNLLHVGPVGIGLDARGGYGKGQGHGYRNFLFGPRFDVKPPLLPIRPYIQASVGFGGVDVHYSGPPAPETHYTNKLQYGLLGGVDFTLIPHIDLRLPELGYLRMSAITSGAPSPALNLFTVGAGIVVRLP